MLLSYIITVYGQTKIKENKMYPITGYWPMEKKYCRRCGGQVECNLYALCDKCRQDDADAADLNGICMDAPASFGDPVGAAIDELAQEQARQDLADKERPF